MSKFSIQFFATGAEISDFVCQMASNANLDLLFKSESGSISFSNAHEAVPDGTSYCFFGKFSSDLTHEDVNTPEFEAKCVGLRFGLGGEILTARGLTESQLWFSGQNPDIAKAARKIQREMKKLLRVGVVLRDPDLGKEAVAKGLKATAGAAAASEEGVVLRPLGGRLVGRTLN